MGFACRATVAAEVDVPKPSISLPPASSVDPFIGTSPNPFTKIGYTFDTGNVFPGAVCPRGMVAWSPDTTHNTNIAGGYWYPDQEIEGFSLTHFSGRGVPCLKDVAFMPITSAINLSPGTHWTQYASTFSHQNETATPGYYHVTLDNGVSADLTAAPRSGMAKFTFPAAASPTLLMRANGAISTQGDTVSGYASSHVGKGGPYRLYFVARFSQPPESCQTWVADKVQDSSSAEGSSSGTILTFKDMKGQSLLARVGISYTSLENARENLAQEIGGSNFATLRAKALSQWNEELGRIEMEGASRNERTIFYTAMYHCFLHPNLLEDVNGQYLGMDDQVHQVDKGHHQYQNIPAWDQHRSLSPLIAIVAQDEANDVLRSLVHYAEQDGKVRANGGGMPRWEQVNRNSGGMVGDGDDTIFATSYAFGARSFDTERAWLALDKGASQPGVTSDGRPVRAALADYDSIGYVPGAASVTLEYCNDDFALSQFAHALGKEDRTAFYLHRAQNWKKLFDASTGYLRPRETNGQWTDGFAPNSGKGFIEGTAAQYRWMVNFNVRGLIEGLGGAAKATERLDNFFTKTNDGLRSQYAYMGNETCEEAPWLYDFAAAPAKTQAIVRRIQTELFTSEPDGLPGNDDAGALSSWYIFSALGLYPEIPGVAGFVVGSPRFPRAVIHLDNGKLIEIVGRDAAPDRPFVQRLEMNGKLHNMPWVAWSELANGGTLHFELSGQASAWGTASDDAPPSFDDDVNGQRGMKVQ